MRQRDGELACYLPALLRKLDELSLQRLLEPAYAPAEELTLALLLHRRLQEIPNTHLLALVVFIKYDCINERLLQALNQIPRIKRLRIA